MDYHHTQRAPLCLILYALAAVLLAAAWICKGEPAISWTFLFSGLPVLLLAASFHHLAVADAGDRLRIQFGPLPLFRRQVKYDDIKSVETGKTTLLDGWGIHWSPQGGWVWNLWGWDCVIVHFRKGILRIGTDDAGNLAHFLRTKRGDGGTAL